MTADGLLGIRRRRCNRFDRLLDDGKAVVMNATGFGRSRCSGASMAIGLFIKWIACVPLYPLEFNLARNDFEVEFFPQIDVLLALPFKVHGFDDVLTVAPQDDSSAGRNHPQP